MTVATRMAIMAEGRVAQVGPPAEVYEYPASRFVAGFVGDVNMIEARVLASERDGMRLASAEAGCEILVDQAAPAAVGETVWVAIRPEKVEIAAAAEGEGAADARPVLNRARGVVEDIAYLGGFSVYRVRLPSGLTLRAAAANRRRLIERPVSWGDEVSLAWGPDAGLVLKS